MIMNTILIIGAVCALTTGQCNVENNVSSYSTNRANNITYDGFDVLYRSEEFPALECDDGYINTQINVYNAPFTTKSNLILVRLDNTIVPGHVARLNNDTQENGNSYKDYNFKAGYVHVYATSWEKEVDYSLTLYSGQILNEVAWPRSDKVQTTITNSYGFESTIGNEFENGVSLGDGVTVKVGNSTSASVTLSYTKTVSSISNDPVMSYHYSSNDDRYEWSLETLNVEVSGAVVYNFSTYYLFELNDNGVLSDCQKSFDLHLDFMYQGAFKPLWWWADGWEFNSSLTIRI